MGLEAYLFRIIFNPPVDEKNLVQLFQKSGMEYLKDKTFYGSSDHYYFEKRTVKGLTECHCAPRDNMLEYCSMRFSVLSPDTVIEQTFEIFNKLDKLNGIEVYDTEIVNQIYLELIKHGKADSSFTGLKNPDLRDEIDNRSYIPLDAEIFRINEYGVQKRDHIINNKKGEIIESGMNSINSISKKKNIEKYMDWIKKYL